MKNLFADLYAIMYSDDGGSTIDSITVGAPKSFKDLTEDTIETLREHVIKYTGETEEEVLSRLKTDSVIDVIMLGTVIGRFCLQPLAYFSDAIEEQLALKDKDIQPMDVDSLNLSIKFTDNNKLRKMPAYATSGSACMDIYLPGESVVILPNETKLIPLGIQLDIPTGYEVQIRSRSSYGKKGLIIPNGIGVIDSDYRGEIGMLLYNSTKEAFTIKQGERVCQMSIHKVTRMNLNEVTTLSETERGTGGFGSTGK